VASKLAAYLAQMSVSWFRSGVKNFPYVSLDLDEIGLNLDKHVNGESRSDTNTNGDTPSAPAPLPAPDSSAPIAKG